MKPLRRAWRSLGRSGALSQRAALLFIPAGLIGPLFFDRARFGGSFLAWLAVAAIAEAVLLLCYALAAPLVRKHVCAAAQPAATLLAICLSASIRGAAISIACVAFDLTTEWEVLYRVLGAGLLFTGAILIVLGSLVATYDHHRGIVRELESKRARLVAARANSLSAVEDTRAQLLVEVRTSIEPRLVEIDQALEAITRGGAPQRGIAALTSLVDDQVRPISHRLSSGPTADLSEEVDPVPSTASRVPLPDRLAISTSIKPLTTGILCVAATIPPSARTLTPSAGLAFVLLFSGLCMVLMVSARTILLGRSAHPIVVALIVTPLYMAVGVGSILLLSGAGLPVPPGLEVPALMFCGVVGAANVGFDVFSAREESTRQELLATVDALQAEVGRLHQASWVAHRQLAYIMHGRVQGTLHAAAMRLSSPQVDAATVLAVQRDIAAAVAELEQPGSDEPPLAEVLTGISDLWRGSCTVDWAVSSETARTLSAHPVTARCVRDVISEAAGNAIHHGRATRVRLDVDMADDHVTIHVSDDGSGLVESARTGLGTTMYDELCTSWRLTRNDDTTLFEARIPISSA